MKSEKVKPFGIQFLETPTEKELKEVNGGRHHKKTTSGGLHSMDIFTSGGVTHYNT
jgi:hypothetical protein